MKVLIECDHGSVGAVAASFPRAAKGEAGGK